MDEEIDSDAGNALLSMTWVAASDGSVPPWSTEQGADTLINVLSTPLPGAFDSSSTTSLILKNGLDGVQYTLGPSDNSASGGAAVWKHTSTFSALSFVLASKRDTRFVYHLSDKAVLALESGTRGNVYVYRTTPKPRDLWAKQSILKIGGGSLLGVSAIQNSQGQPVILCLTDEELVIAHDVL